MEQPVAWEETPAISVKHISKSFRVYYDKGLSLKDMLLFRSRRRYEIHQVIRDLSFEVRKGEAIGLIGQNGCGKSTTLKMLTRIMYPDSGSIVMNGRVSALIELGAGFHPDMSGRENIYTNAAIFGLSRKEIDRRIDSIIDFSELGDAIDNPVRTYSSGMYMRLAFSVAINVDADILLVDEILAVGDAAFQAKCFQKIRDLKAQGVTIVIVSHALGQIEQICDRSIWIEDGVIRMEGSPYDVHPYYLEAMDRRNKRRDPPTSAFDKRKRWGEREIEVDSVRMFDARGEECRSFSTGESVTVKLSYHRNDPSIRRAVVGFGIFRLDGTNCYGVNTLIDRMGEVELPDSGTVTIHLSELTLLPGDYFLDVAIHREDGFAYDFWKETNRFRMYSGVKDEGVARLAHSWEFE